MVLSVQTDFIAVGGNRHPAAADWDSQSGLVAFGADRNVALWNALDRNHRRNHRGICALLSGHTDRVNVVKFWKHNSLKEPLILSGSADGSIRVWKVDLTRPELSRAASVIYDSEHTINTIAVETRSGIFVSGSASPTIKIRRIDVQEDGALQVYLQQTISIVPRFFPLALALSPLSILSSSLVLAVGGTKSIIQVYVAEATENCPQFHLQATLGGHDGWIRSLAFIPEKTDASSDLLLASASQDKYIRLWRVHQGEQLPPATAAGTGLALGTFGKSLSNKAHRFHAKGLEYSITFEALLLGHDDWIYTASWFRGNHSLQLLSASADSSLAIWEADPTSGVWICLTRLGEISGQKGATTATGSPGGYWIGLWSPSGESILSLGRTGGWRIWSYGHDQGRWVQDVAVGGHVKQVTGLAWARDGGYLLSTSSDQTTRLFAEWKREKASSWHELSRPQIHGYDLNCIDSLDPSRFVSGADEKLLRVFEQPQAVANLLETLCDIQGLRRDERPDAASIPMLGLSNKAVQVVDEECPVPTGEDEGNKAMEDPSQNQDSDHDADHPPIEDQLARHTLWPESEKLYGHGHEISAVAVSSDATLVATACRASSIDHAVIRLYESEEWREVRPALSVHSLTVARLRFSQDDQYLLSVGRDRMWAVFKRDEQQPNSYHLASSNPKAHSRTILDGSWAPVDSGRVFATASRDKSAKIWQVSYKDGVTAVSCKGSLSAVCPVTAVDFLPQVVRRRMCLATGHEDGSIQLHALGGDDDDEFQISNLLNFDSRIVPARSIRQLSWRGTQQVQKIGIQSSGRDVKEQEHDRDTWQIAVSSEDTSVRIFSICGL